jgi:hypothetical protein
VLDETLDIVLVEVLAEGVLEPVSGTEDELASAHYREKEERRVQLAEDVLAPPGLKQPGVPRTGGALPKLHALNVVMRGALGGGATRTLRFDATGKSMCSILSWMDIGE